MYFMMSYRRDDSMSASGRIYENLRDRFGPDSVFFDQSEIDRAGRSFPQEIARAIQRAATVVAVIGQNWATIRDDAENLRLHDPNDMVRWELRYAMQLGKSILPVLVEDARMPHPDQLPEDIRGICVIEAIKVRSDRDFYGDMQRLCSLLGGTMTSEGMGGALLTPLREDSRGELDNQRRAMNRALDDPTSIEFPGNPLRDAIEYLSALHQLPILTDDQSIASTGITVDEEVSLVLHGWPLRRALDVLLENVAGVPLAYLVEDERIVVTTSEVAEEFLETLVYDVDDLIVRGMAPQKLSELVHRHTSGPWMIVDGIGGAISPHSGFLSIHASQRLHAEVEKYLRSVRSAFSRRERAKFLRMG